jgi:hypothetical protein
MNAEELRPALHRHVNASILALKDSALGARPSDPDECNARSHPDSRSVQIAASIGEFDFLILLAGVASSWYKYT